MRNYSLAAVARMCGCNHITFWNWVHNQHLLPMPSTPVGRRMFYKESQLPEIKRTVEELRKDPRRPPFKTWNTR